jgi:hypothetical protein
MAYYLSLTDDRSPTTTPFMNTPNDMNTPSEDDTPIDDASDDRGPDDGNSDTRDGNSNTPSSASNSSSESAAADGGRPAGSESTLMPEEWGRLRAPFSRHAYIVKSRATGRGEANLPVDSRSGNGKEDGSNRTVVDLRLRPEAIRDRLDRVLSPDRYSYRFEPGPESGGMFAMFCHLRIGSATRTGIGTDTRSRKAGRLALAEAALAFGIGASGQISGPVLADHHSRYKLSEPILEALEQEQRPARWAPGEEAA